MTPLITKKQIRISGDNDVLKKWPKHAIVAESASCLMRVLTIAVKTSSFQDVLKHGKTFEVCDWFHINEFPVGIKNGISLIRHLRFLRKYAKIQHSQPEV